MNANVFINMQVSIITSIFTPVTVGAALYTESLFKFSNVKGETFLDQQFWMYFYETLMAILLHALTNPSYQFPSLTKDLLG